MKLLLATNEGKVVKTFEDIEDNDLDKDIVRAALAAEIQDAIAEHRKKKTLVMPAVKI